MYFRLTVHVCRVPFVLEMRRCCTPVDTLQGCLVGQIACVRVRLFLFGGTVSSVLCTMFAVHLALHRPCFSRELMSNVSRF